MSKLCFSFPAGMAPETRTRAAAPPGADACSSDQADAPLRMPFSCFGYPADASRDAGNRDAGLSEMTGSACFRY